MDPPVSPPPSPIPFQALNDCSPAPESDNIAPRCLHRTDVQDIFDCVMADESNDTQDVDVSWILEAEQCILQAGGQTPPNQFDAIMERLIMALGDKSKAFSTDPGEIPDTGSNRVEDNESYINRKVKKLMQQGATSKISRTLESKGISDLGKREVRLRLHSKFPMAEHDHLITVPPVESSILLDIGGKDVLLGYLQSIHKGAARSLNGGSTDKLKLLFAKKPSLADPFIMILRRIASGHLTDRRVWSMLLDVRAIPLYKEGDDSRPIVCQNAITKALEHMLCKKFMKKASEACGISQVGNAVPGGIEALVHTVRGVLEVDPTHAVIALDSSNAFNSLSPRSAYDAVRKYLPELQYYAYFILSSAPQCFFHKGAFVICITYNNWATLRVTLT